MIDQEFRPAPGGLKRLQMRLDAQERQAQQEARIYQMVACVLLIVFAGLFHRDRSESLPKSEWRSGEKIQVKDAKLVEVPVKAENVRFFWIAP